MYSRNRHNGSTAILRKFLRERLGAFLNKASPKPEDSTENGIYYIVRRRLLALGIDPNRQGKNFRRNLTAKIKVICERLGVDREEIGIFAGTSAFLYYKGKKELIDYNNASKLMQNGTDIILIEKQGMADVLRPYTDKAGIALITNRGFFVKYASSLARNAKTSGANIAMVTDLDVSGLLMERSLRDEVYNIPRLGIDFETLEYFGLTREDVQEDINTDQPYSNTEKTSYNHWEGLRKKRAAYWRGETKEQFKEIMTYLEHKRIEIDSIVTHPKVGNEKFAKYIIDRLAKEFPTRNYNRVIEVPDSIIPTVLSNLVTNILSKTKNIIKDKRAETVQKLMRHEGIIDDVTQKESEIDQELTDLIYKDTKLGPILEKIEYLLQEID